MKRAVLSIALITALAGCQQSSDPEPAPAPREAVEAAAQPVIEAVEAVIEETEQAAPQLADLLYDVLRGEHRSEDNRARDRYRNPAPTLAFFGLSTEHTVVEINPGGGWYSEIVAPIVDQHGRYIAAMIDPNIEGVPGYAPRQAEAMQVKLKENNELMGNAHIHFYDPTAPQFGEPGSADLVLTFRNVHGWINGGQAETMFDAFFEVLKPGGALGVVQHRAAEDADITDSARNGYVPEAAVIALATAAGFEFAERAEINANPRDTRDHPRGVWSLPPTLAADPDSEDEEAMERLREERRAIGESDRMTLRFVKPATDGIFSSN